MKFAIILLLGFLASSAKATSRADEVVDVVVDKALGISKELEKLYEKLAVIVDTWGDAFSEQVGFTAEDEELDKTSGRKL
jgi:hypothetical protein